MAESDGGGGKIIIEDGLLRAGFVQLPILLARDPNLSPGAKLVYVALLWYHWRGQDYPGQHQLAEDFGLSPRSAWTYLKELEREGYLESQRPGLGQPNRLVLHSLLPEIGSGRDRQLFAAPATGTEGIPLQVDPEAGPPLIRKICESGLAKSAGLDSRNLPVSLVERQDSDSTRTESGAAREPTTGARVPGGKSDSDFADFCEATATALGRPREGKQLATWAKREGIGREALRAALERTQQRLQEEDLGKPVAYLQTVAARIAEGQRLVAEAKQQTQAEAWSSWKAYARSTYADGAFMGRTWQQVERILEASFGAETAAALVRECELEAQANT